MSCGDTNVIIQPDPAIQRTEDSIIIINHLFDLGYEENEIGATVSGVRYVIVDSGNMESIDESDHVTFDYVGKLLNDTIFDTSIRDVADSIRMKVEQNITQGDTLDVEFALLSSFSENRTFNAFQITYSSTGWPFPREFIRGFADGIAATFNKMKVGGSALIVIPSGEAYRETGSGFFIPGNTVIAFELYPTKVSKQ